MTYRSLAFTAALLLGACSKSEPGVSTTTSAPASAAPTTTGGAGGAPNQAPPPPAPAGDDAHKGHPGPPSGTPMHKDGGMGCPGGRCP